jgi:hypothetical protein
MTPHPTHSHTERPFLPRLKDGGILGGFGEEQDMFEALFRIAFRSELMSRGNQPFRSRNSDQRSMRRSSYLFTHRSTSSPCYKHKEPSAPCGLHSSASPITL